MNLKKFVNPLPSMERIKPIQTGKHGDYYEVMMEQFQQKVHRDLPPTTVWGYNRQFPGPLFDVDQGNPIHVKWINNLPNKHLLPVDKSVHNVARLPEVRTVTHLHGSETESDSDGYPDAWYTKNYQKVGPEFKQTVYTYPNQQRATALWYHDHAMGITRLNMYAGLAGMYLIRDDREKALPLPKDDYEIPLIIQDRSFQDNGSLAYPSQPDDPADNLPNPSITPFFLGDTIVVNGKVWPFLKVEPRKYRFRILNASNTRSYQMYLDPRHPFFQIGTDGGLMAKTIPLHKITMEPAERVDLIIDFSKLNGKKVTLKNDLGDNADPDDRTNEIMQFQVVKPLKRQDTSKIPKQLTNITSLKQDYVKAIRYLTLNGKTDKLGRPLLLLDNKKWADPVTEKPRLGTTEIWSLMNLTDFTHPIHIHLIQFQVLDRRPFDLDFYQNSGQIKYTGPAKPPEKNERGWKDTVAAHSAEITRLLVHFSPYAGDYVWHCHILEHEDYDMMRPLTVIESSDYD